MAAGLGADQSPLLCALHLVQQVLHLGPGLVALVDDHYFVY